MELLLVSDLFNKLADYNVALRFNSNLVISLPGRTIHPETSAQLNEAIKKIYAVNPNFGEALFQKYFPVNYSNTAVFSEQESTFIHKNGPFKVAVVKNNYPFYYIKDGEPKVSFLKFLH